MFNLDPAKLLVISVIGLVVIGPERLPRLARQFGSALHVLTTYREQAEAEIRKAVPDLGLPTIPRNPASVVGTFLTSLPPSTELASPVNGDAPAPGLPLDESLPLIADAERLMRLVQPHDDGVGAASGVPVDSVGGGRFDNPEMN